MWPNSKQELMRQYIDLSLTTTTFKVARLKRFAILVSVSEKIVLLNSRMIKECLPNIREHSWSEKH